MKQKIRLSESQLRKLIKESVMDEVNKEKVMSQRYGDIFVRRVRNAVHGDVGEVKRTVREFYEQFKDKIQSEDFNIKNLMELADKIELKELSGLHGNFRGGSQGFADKWWGLDLGKELEESRKKVKLNESQLRNLIRESVMKVMNEISSDMISRAEKKFHLKYGGTDFPGPDAKDFPKDEYGNLLYPKDKRTLAQHYRNFDDAYKRAKYSEQFDDPITKEAMEIWNENVGDVDWEITDDFGNEGCEVGGWLEVDGWEFSASGFAEKAGGLDVQEIESVEFRSPDGQEGSFRP